METNKKEMLKGTIKVIEKFYVQGELERIKLERKIMRTIGIDLVHAIIHEKDFDKVVHFCREYVQANKVETGWLIRKGMLGLPLTYEEKVEVAYYYTAIVHLIILD